MLPVEKYTKIILIVMTLGSLGVGMIMSVL